MKSAFLIALIVALASCQGAEVAEPLSGENMKKILGKI